MTLLRMYAPLEVKRQEEKEYAAGGRDLEGGIMNSAIEK